MWVLTYVVHQRRANVTSGVECHPSHTIDCKPASTGSRVRYRHINSRNLTNKYINQQPQQSLFYRWIIRQVIEMIFVGWIDGQIVNAADRVLNDRRRCRARSKVLNTTHVVAKRPSCVSRKLDTRHQWDAGSIIGDRRKRRDRRARINSTQLMSIVAEIHIIRIHHCQ
jgi:hypothetical protein